MMNSLRLLMLLGAGGQSPSSADTLMTLGPVRVVVKEETWESPQPPALYLEVETLAQYGCLWFGIEDSLERRGDTLFWNAYGVVPPAGLCPAAIGPARRTRRLSLAPGTYTLRMSYRRRSASFGLLITDSSVALSARDTSFFIPDQRLWWRYPPASLALMCENMEYAAAVCGQVREWLGRQPGISTYSLGPTGINPYAPEPDRTPDRSLALFHYGADSNLVRVRQCLAEVHARIHRMAGVTLTIRTWTGVDIHAWSNGSVPGSRAPKSVTSGHFCHEPGSPDPDTMPKLPSDVYQIYSAILAWVAAGEKADRLLLHDMAQGYGGRPPRPEPSYTPLQPDSVLAPVPVTFLGDSVDSARDWRALYRGRAHASGVLRLYHPEFNPDSTEGTAWLEDRCAPGLCGGIREFQLARDDDGRWTITKVVMRVYY